MASTRSLNGGLGAEPKAGYRGRDHMVQSQGPSSPEAETNQNKIMFVLTQSLSNVITFFETAYLAPKHTEVTIFTL